ncbi:gliding motility-associated-like protein [Arcticibacter tournemirensis]|uniref:PKD domain-containing protein n=1 Tax=Arcticibacter tournemirensis TaxID=699437 RepID=A0A5M9H0B1_9SPHI|nr:PKD domain-containing protein [Arcticibacter tournemirensis]KAA8478498.1 PKD domain-containing protein [Arcticibacter tournemirensis]TQM51155.1 gliding motility-associated-like protein [Arcticibacter tournemirensis]
MVKNRLFFWYALFLSLVCFWSLVCQVASAQNISNKGKDFWLGYGNHQRGYNLNNQEMVLYITSDVNTKGKIEIPGLNYSSDFTVTANSISQVMVPKEAYLDGEGLYKSGIHVTAEKPVVIYAHIYDRNVSGATLVLPTNVLGKEYYSLNYKQVSNQDTSFSYFFVVAIEDSTEVQITPSANTYGGQDAGKSFTVKLNKGEIYQILGEKLGSERIDLGGGRSTRNYKGADLTGSIIQSVGTTTQPCKKIAVFSGSGKIGIGCESEGIGSSDNLFQQVYPTTAWGKKTITVPLASRNYDVIRIVKSNPAAVVKLNGNVVTFSNSLYYEFPSQQVNVIESDLPVQVVQYAVTQGKGINCSSYSENAGDPEMIFLNPVEQNIDRITVYSADAYLIIRHFINVVIETSAAQGFTLDGISQASQFRSVPGDPGYSYAQLSVSAGVHTLAAPKGFNAVAYGFGGAESYGYSAGANVKGQLLKAVNKLTGLTVSSGCTYQPLKFSVNLLYEVNKLTWDLNNGEATEEVSYSAPETTFTENGKTYFVYSLAKDVVYDKAQDYNIEITAEKTMSDGCGTSESILIDFSVYDPPEPSFSVSAACEDTEVQFSDETDGKGRVAKTWLWNFGDGKTSDEQNPKHVYEASGTYTVTLTVTTDSGCSSITSAPLTVTIYKKPTPGFSVSGNCADQKVVFTDLSVSEEGNIVQWAWDFGDGTTDTLLSGTPREHVYPAGTYSVKLTVLTDKGCKHDVLQNVEISPSPVADFSLPGICSFDNAQFTNLSTIADHTEASFQYEWDFGDVASGALNRSTQRDPQHRYSIPGEYTATLTVTSGKGCLTTVSKTFIVNGSNPVPDFEVPNYDRLCSRNEVVFINKSSVSIGRITRLEWTFSDPDGNTKVVADDNPEPGKEQRVLFPEFTAPDSKVYTVSLKAFSGGVCVREKSGSFTLLAMPKVTFEAPGDVCQESGPLQLVAGQETAFLGSSTFSGDGITSSGIFDPGKAGPGAHDITFTFTRANGCPDALTRTIIVNPSPSVSAGEDVKIREGTFTQLLAHSDADIVSYEWTPSEGLSRNDIANPIASPFDNTTYTLKVTNSRGCINYSRVTVTVDKYPVIPNVFTPNGDGTNDKWNIKYLVRYSNATVDVFNRYGNRVYQSRGYAEPWDGTFNGTALPAGAYYYIIDPKNGMGPYKGNINIIR